MTSALLISALLLICLEKHRYTPYRIKRPHAVAIPLLTDVFQLSQSCAGKWFQAAQCGSAERVAGITIDPNHRHPLYALPPIGLHPAQRFTGFRRNRHEPRPTGVA